MVQMNQIIQVYNTYNMDNIKLKKSYNNSYKFPLMVLFLIIDLGDNDYYHINLKTFL